MSTTISTKRIEWIDALRGFTMLFVVYYHLEVCGLFIDSPAHGLNSFFRTFRMPLFFFISGFVAYKNNELWNLNNYKTKLIKKLRVQIVPMLFFGLLYSMTVHANDTNTTPLQSILLFFNQSEKLGYWFTEALLLMFIIYYTVSFLLRKKNLKIRQFVLVGISIGAYLLAFRSVTHYQHIQIANWLGLYNLLLYLQFFVFGNIVSCYRKKLFKILDSSLIRGAIIILLAGVYILYLSQEDVQSSYIHTGTTKILIEAISYLGILTTLNVFRHYSQFFSSETKIGSGLQYIGRRTLDIYLIHWFLIPVIPSLGTFFTENHLFILETTTVILISLLIIQFTLIISNIIRTSPFLAYWLLGVKREKK